MGKTEVGPLKQPNTVFQERLHDGKIVIIILKIDKWTDRTHEKSNRKIVGTLSLKHQLHKDIYLKFQCNSFQLCHLSCL